MLIRLVFLILCFLSLNIFAQNINTRENSQSSAVSTQQPADKLLQHLKAAEKYQIAGDLINASIENKAILGIALIRSGNIAIEEGRYTDAVRTVKEALKFADNSPNRTLLAISYLRQNKFDEALSAARSAVLLDPEHIGARYILSNIYYTKEDYKNALPELERVFAETPDFEMARALGLTYLNLRMIEKARLHFEKMRVSLGKETADLHILFAKLYERTNYPDDAERELKRALEIAPNKPKLNFYLGYLLLQNGGSERLDEAGAAFERELELNPNDFYALFFSGVVASSLNKHKEAIPFLEKATQINPNSGEAFLFLGQSQIELNDLVNAEKNLRRAVALENNGGKNTQARRTHFMLGRLLLKTGRREEAKKELEIARKLQQDSLNSSRNEIERILGQVAESDEEANFGNNNTNFNVPVKLTPERVEQLKKVKIFLTNVIAQAYSNLGVIATQNNQINIALENFSAAYRWKPDFPNLARNMGIISFRAGEYTTAITPLSEHLTKNPEDILSRKLLGSSYYLTNDFKRAAEILRPIENKISADAELAYFYGISLIRLKRDREAIPVFDRLAKISGQNPEPVFYAARGFMMLGDYNRAVAEFERVIAMAPQTSKANYFIGQSLLRLNRHADAEKAFARELEINPNDAISKYHLALTYIERKIEPEKTVAMLKEAINLRPGYADAHYQLGKIYLEKGELEKAVEQLEKGVSADANKDYIHYQLSIAYRKMSRKEDADRELKIYQKLKREKRKTDAPAPMGNN